MSELNDNIKISTSADLSGAQAVQRALTEIRNLASEISQKGISLTASQSQQSRSFAQSSREHTERMQGAANSTIGASAINQGGQQYTPPNGSQVGEWMVQNMPIINNIMGNSGNNGSRRSGSRVQRFEPRPGTIPTPPSVARRYRSGGQDSPEYVRDWFQSVERNLTPNTPAHDEWHAANASWVQGEEGAPGTFYRRFAAEANMRPVTPNNPNVSPPSSIGGNLLGTILRRALPSSGVAGAIGSAIGGVGIGGLALGGIAAAGVGLAVNSFGKYTKSGDELSGLTKQILSTKDSLETLQSSVLSAGAAMAMNADITAKVANTLGNAYGSMSLSTLSSRVSQVGGMGLAYGISPDVLSQGFAGAANMGITAGRGSTMSQGQLAFGLAGSAAQSGMSGRMADLMQEFLMSVQGTESTNPVANSSSLLNIITSMNSALPRSMTGVGGASILNQIGNSIANPNSFQQMINYQALNGAGVHGYFDIMRAQQEGPGNILPNGKTNAEAVLGQYSSVFGKNADYFMQKGLGVSMPQADELLKVFGKGGTGISSITNNLGVKPSDLQGADWSKLAILSKLGAAKNQSDLQSVISDYGANGGTLSDEQKKALAGGSFSDQQKMLAQDILKGQYNPKTTTEKIDTMNATVTTLQIKTAGSAASGAAGAASGVGGIIGKNASDMLKAYNDATGPNAKKYWSDELNNIKNNAGKAWNDTVGKDVPAISKFFSNMLDTIKSNLGMGGTPTAYNPQSGVTPGGYNYSPAMTAITVGMNGMNNAFGWVSAKSGTNGGPSTVSYGSKSSGSYSGSSVSSSILGGIMSVESGGNPYSLNDNTTGRSYSLKSESEYLSTGKRLLAAGDSVDMGLMQINSKAHPDVTLNQAENTSFSVNWASDYLNSLHDQTGSWDKAIEAYNTGPGGVGSRQALNYLDKVKSAEQKFDMNDASIAKLAQAIASALGAKGHGWTV